MRKLLAIFVAVFIIFIGAGLWLYWPNNVTPSTTLDDSALGPCNRDRYVEYLVKAGELAPAAAGQGRGLTNPDVQSRLIEAFEAYEKETDKTYIFVTYAETGELFASACTSEKCTETEFFEAEQACLRKHLGGCSTWRSMVKMKPIVQLT